MDWFEEAKKKREINPKYGYGSIAKDYGLTWDTVRSRFRREDRKKANGGEIKEFTEDFTITDDLYKILKDGKIHSINSLCDSLKVNPKILFATIESLQEDGYQIENNCEYYQLARTTDQSQNVYNPSWEGEQELTFAIVSDTHLGSKSQQLTYLNDFYDRCVLAGVKNVYHAGDWIDGMEVYEGQTYNLHSIGMDAQKEYAVKYYPYRKGITTRGIGGNHDLKTFAKTGYDVIKAIAKERADIEYLGQYFARVNLTPKCVLQLCHPMGKQAYSVSYRIQRKVDSLFGGDKPAIIAEGHFHSSCWLFRRNVQALMLPSFQGPNDLSRRLGLESDIGGAIITARFDKEGTIREFTPKFIPYMKPLVNDY